MGEIFESIKALISMAMLAAFVCVLLPVVLVFLSVLTASWIPIVLGVGIVSFAFITIIKKNQKEQEAHAGEDNKLFNPELQEKAIQYMLTAREKEKEQAQA